MSDRTGHGLQVGGQNYLVPVDARIHDELDVPTARVAVDGRPVGEAGHRRPLNLISGLPVGRVRVVVEAGKQGCAQCPVEQLSLDDVELCIRTLNAKTGRTYRLPSEAEWEYACRSGGRDQRYCGGDDLGALAWYKSSGGAKTHPVGQKFANGLGLYDMIGNVSEWTQDCWNSSYHGAPNDGSASRRGDCNSRVVRGGSWTVHPYRLRSAYRTRYTRDYRFNILGLRLARAL